LWIGGGTVSRAVKGEDGRATFEDNSSLNRFGVNAKPAFSDELVARLACRFAKIMGALLHCGAQPPEVLPKHTHKARVFSVVG
jgi:hypothetical protein